MANRISIITADDTYRVSISTDDDGAFNHFVYSMRQVKRLYGGTFDTTTKPKAWVFGSNALDDIVGILRGDRFCEFTIELDGIVL